jgi:hypothetical protein
MRSISDETLSSRLALATGHRDAEISFQRVAPIAMGGVDHRISKVRHGEKDFGEGREAGQIADGKP